MTIIPDPAVEFLELAKQSIQTTDHFHMACRLASLHDFGSEGNKLVHRGLCEIGEGVLERIRTDFEAELGALALAKAARFKIAA